MGTVAALVAVVLVLGLSGAPDNTPAPQYTAAEVEAHFRKQQEAARQAEMEREAAEARAAQAQADSEIARLAEERQRAEAEAAMAAEQQNQAEVALQAERTRQAEAERLAQQAAELAASDIKDESVPEAPAMAETPVVEENLIVAEPTAVPDQESGIETPVIALESPVSPESDRPVIAADREPEAQILTELPVAAEKPAVTEPPVPAEPVFEESPEPVDETPKAVPTPAPLPSETVAVTEPDLKPAPEIATPKTVTVPPSADGSPKLAKAARPQLPKTTTRGVTITGTASRPQFPWPPPQASTVVRLPLSRFQVDLTRGVHGEVAGLLEDALDHGGYFDRSFWVAPGGFALATRLERISSDGLAVETDERWPTSSLKERFDLSKYLRALFYTDPGYFRVIVFVLSTEFERTSDDEPTPKGAVGGLRRGVGLLPRDMAEQELTSRHELTALIYEFEREAGSDAIVLAPGRLTGRTHLAQAKLQRLLGAE